MSRIFDADSSALLTEHDIFKIGGKEYKVPDIKMGTMLKFEKLEQSNESKFGTLVEQIYLVLKDCNKVTKEDIESWGFKTCLAFVMWLFEPLQELGQKKNARLTSKKGRKGKVRLAGIFAQMIRYYNGGFDHWKLMELTYKQFLMYYSCLIDMLETENGKEEKKTSNPNEVMQNIKNTLNS